jgi:hypothetical protein
MCETAVSTVEVEGNQSSHYEKQIENQELRTAIRHPSCFDVKVMIRRKVVLSVGTAGGPSKEVGGMSS